MRCYQVINGDGGYRRQQLIQADSGPMLFSLVRGRFYVGAGANVARSICYSQIQKLEKFFSDWKCPYRHFYIKFPLFVIPALSALLSHFFKQATGKDIKRQYWRMCCFQAI